MSVPTFNDSLQQDIRSALQRYYNSQCMTHGGYVIALIVGVSVLISRWDAFSPNFWTFLFFYIIIAGLIILLIYAVVRSLYWGSLATYVMRVNLNYPREDEKDLISDLQSDNLPSMFILHKLTIERAKKESKGIVKYIYKIFSRTKQPARTLRLPEQ